MAGVIYKITNPTGKIYIGCTIDWKRRFSEYRRLSMVGQKKLYNSLKKYGWINHNYEIIEECSLELLSEKETHWKQYYLNQFNGDWTQVLFCNLYDTGGGPKSELTKQKMSEGKKGTKGYPKGVKRPLSFGENLKSEERNKKIGEGNKGKKKPQTGIKLQGIPKTEQHKQNISISSKGKTRNNKAIHQYDLEGNFIKEWISRTEAKKWLGPGDIAGCFSGRQKQAGGFIWVKK